MPQTFRSLPNKTTVALSPRLFSWATLARSAASRIRSVRGRSRLLASSAPDPAASSPGSPTPPLLPTLPAFRPLQAAAARSFSPCAGSPCLLGLSTALWLGRPWPPPSARPVACVSGTSVPSATLVTRVTVPRTPMTVARPWCGRFSSSLLTAWPFSLACNALYTQFFYLTFPPPTLKAPCPLDSLPGCTDWVLYKSPRFTAFAYSVPDSYNVHSQCCFDSGFSYFALHLNAWVRVSEWLPCTYYMLLIDIKPDCFIFPMALNPQSYPKR